VGLGGKTTERYARARGPSLIRIKVGTTPTSARRGRRRSERGSVPCPSSTPASHRSRAWPAAPTRRRLGHPRARPVARSVGSAAPIIETFVAPPRPTEAYRGVRAGSRSPRRQLPPKSMMSRGAAVLSRRPRRGDRAHSRALDPEVPIGALHVHDPLRETVELAQGRRRRRGAVVAVERLEKPGRDHLERLSQLSIRGRVAAGVALSAKVSGERA
jgi:hypothetical protein